MSDVYSQQRHHGAKNTPSAVVSMSRFSHFQNFPIPDSRDGMIIVTGLGFRHTAHRSHRQLPGIDGVFLATVVGASTHSRQFTTTVVKPTTTKEKGLRFTYTPQNDSGSRNEFIGRVTVRQERNGEERIMVERKLKLPNDQFKPIVVYILNHNDQTRYEIVVRPADTVKSLRKQLWQELSIQHEDTILYNGKTLTRDHTLAYYDIKEKCTLHLTVSMIGG